MVHPGLLVRAVYLDQLAQLGHQDPEDLPVHLGREVNVDQLVQAVAPALVGLEDLRERQDLPENKATKEPGDPQVCGQ